MHTLLASKLIDKGAIRTGTAFVASHRALGLSCVRNAHVEGDFVLTAAHRAKDGSRVTLDAISSDGRTHERFTSDEVIAIDGMDIERFARNYNLAVDGADLKVSKRRGRRPRSMMALVEAPVAHA